ncbi:MAG: hypothetical protein JSW37_11560, partial [Anaerolineales bacterium]
RLHIPLLLLLIPLLFLTVGPSAVADTGDDAGPDLSNIGLTLDDLPPGFQQLPMDASPEFASLLDDAIELLANFTEARPQRMALFYHEDPDQEEALAAVLLWPVSQMQFAALQLAASNTDRASEVLEQLLEEDDGMLGLEPLTVAVAAGARTAGLSLVTGPPQNPVRGKAAFLWRGQVVAALWTQHLENRDPALDIGMLSTLVDQRIADAMATERFPYRPAGPLALELTTYIPTPLDISTDPQVIGANLGLAAAAVLLLAVIQEAVNQTLSEHEEVIRQKLGRVTFFSRMIRPAERPESAPPRGRLQNAVTLVLIVLLYGLIFSLLERGWNPFSRAGVYVLLSMSLANGLVGLSDDVAEWRTARRWGLPTRVEVQRGNVVLAVASTLGSRLLSLVPGIWFGGPEAFEVDSASLDPHRARRLMIAGLRTLLALGTAVWLLSGVTAAVMTLLPILALRVDAASEWASWIDGLQSFLLLTFGSAAQTAFLALVGLPGTVGRALRERSVRLWVLGMLSSAFVYFHALLNPQGDLAAALQTTNVRAFLLTAAGLAILAVGAWLYFQSAYRKPAAVAGPREEEPEGQEPAGPDQEQERAAEGTGHDS